MMINKLNPIFKIFKNDFIFSSIYGNGKILDIIKKQDNEEYFTAQFENGIVTTITRKDIKYLLINDKKIEINA